MVVGGDFHLTRPESLGGRSQGQPIGMLKGVRIPDLFHTPGAMAQAAVLLWRDIMEAWKAHSPKKATLGRYSIHLGHPQVLLNTRDRGWIHLQCLFYNTLAFDAETFQTAYHQPSPYVLVVVSGCFMVSS